MIQILLAAIVLALGFLGQPEKSKPDAAPGAVQGQSILAHKIKLIDGKEQDLSAYRGKVVILVNVASKCGYTGQYEPLEKMYKAKKDAGLVILAFPANNFNAQEPGSNEEIIRFCEGKYGVTFPMFQKISVKGEDAHPLYQSLAKLPEPLGGPPKWNFTKFIVDREGKVVARFDAKKRDGLEDGLVEKVDELLAKK